MEFVLQGNTLYGQKQQQTNIPIQNLDSKREQNAKVHPVSEVFQHSVFNFQDLELSAILKGEGSSGDQLAILIIQSLDGKQQIKIPSQRKLLEEYFFLLSSTHECIIQYDKNLNSSYQGRSSDEITLVDAAARMGFQFTGASASEQNFQILGKDKKVKLLKSLEFDSTHQRMSVIIDDNGVIKLFIKGADTFIYLNYLLQKQDIYIILFYNKYLRANIKVWMLTGDKLETAENIESCRLIQGDFTVMRLSEASVEEFQTKIGDFQEKHMIIIQKKKERIHLWQKDNPYNLQYDNEDLAQAFSMAKDCESVVCCRVTPKQKADVVRLIKDRLNKIILQKETVQTMLI
ncbi:unnamed protein product [Paramecium sonneborni]|uniref:Uncharacterized protein n=1 Tax=Paramecium sonneborni TaxID=65129 RepID=A0A8S1PHK8_9CILI|nr:unnamed protein product [Paramecium sonneborni]